MRFSAGRQILLGAVLSLAPLSALPLVGDAVAAEAHNAAAVTAPEAARNQYCAVVSSNGTLARGVNVNFSRLAGGVGRYEVSFFNPVRNCAWTATVYGSPGEISTVTPPSNSQFGVGIRTYTSDGKLYANRSFTLLVTC